MNATAADPKMVLVDALKRHGWDDWYSALLHAAMQETKDAGRAVKVADKAFAEHPTDESAPRDDDAEALFGKPDVALSSKDKTGHLHKDKGKGGGQFTSGGDGGGGGKSPKSSVARQDDQEKSEREADRQRRPEGTKRPEEPQPLTPEERERVRAQGMPGPGKKDYAPPPKAAGPAIGVSPRLDGEADKAYAKRVIDKLNVTKLPENHDKYFNTEKADGTCSMEELVSSKSEEENKQGGANAPARMWAASKGLLSKRDPITVRKVGDKYHVLDGNGTFTAAKALGWKSLPVEVAQLPWDDDGSDVVKTHNSMNVPRNEMPNIPGNKMHEFFEELRENGAKVESRQIESGKLKPIQGELSKSQMAVISKLPEEKQKMPVIASSDGYLLDGHHRWGSIVAHNPKDKINAHVVDMPMKDLLEAAGNFHGTVYKEAMPSVFTPEEHALPKDAHQPIAPNAGYAGLAEKGKEATHQLQQLLDLGRGVGAQLGYKTSQPKTDDEMIALCHQPGGHVVIAPVKSEKRSTEKVNSDYKGDWSKLIDVARASIIVDTMDDVRKTVETLRKNNTEFARKPKDRMTETSPSAFGYRDCLTNVRMPNGIVGELQILCKEMMIAKVAGHKEYEVTRSIDGKMKDEGRKIRTPEEDVEYQRAAGVMKKLYGDAWEKCKGKGEAGATPPAAPGGSGSPPSH